MIKKSVTVFLALALLAVSAKSSFVVAKTVCTQQYGGAYECYEEKEEVMGEKHEPVKAGIADNPLVVVSSLALTSGILYLLSRKFSKKEIFISS